MEPLNCSYCIVEQKQLVPAVTITRGYAVCVQCNFELHEHLDETTQQIQAIADAARQRASGVVR